MKIFVQFLPYTNIVASAIVCSYFGLPACICWNLAFILGTIYGAF